MGAPKANTSSLSSVLERGAVYSCPWNSVDKCTQIEFDNTGELSTFTAKCPKGSSMGISDIIQNAQKTVFGFPLLMIKIPKKVVLIFPF